MFAADTALGLLTPGTSESSCQAGIGQDSEMPPPAAPQAAPSFQTCSRAGCVALSIVVPPAATTYGWLDGSSTDRTGLTGAAVPRAVVAPLVTGSREDGLSLGGRLLEDEVLCLLDAGRALLDPCSHSPQLVVTTWSTLSFTICAYSSSAPKVLFGAS